MQHQRQLLATRTHTHAHKHAYSEIGVLHPQISLGMDSSKCVCAIDAHRLMALGQWSSVAVRCQAATTSVNNDVVKENGLVDILYEKSVAENADEVMQFLKLNKLRNGTDFEQFA